MTVSVTVSVNGHTSLARQVRCPYSLAHVHRFADASTELAASVDFVAGRTTPAGGYARWKALLRPAEAGGNYTATVACSAKPGMRT